MSDERLHLDTQQLACAVHNDLWAGGRPNQLIADSSGQPLAVKIPGLLTAADLAEITPHIAASGYYEGKERVRRTSAYSQLNQDPEYGGILPIGYYSGVRFPDSVTRVADQIVRQSANRGDVRAVNLTVSDARTNESPRHFDNPKNPLNKYPTRSLGSNLHISLIGGAVAELALLDDEQALHEVAAIESNIDQPATDDDEITAARDRQLSALYLGRCLAWAKIHLEPGDGLYMQGEARLVLGRFPVVHRFIPLAGQAAIRRYAVIKPQYDQVDRVLRLRAAAEREVLA